MPTPDEQDEMNAKPEVSPESQPKTVAEVSELEKLKDEAKAANDKYLRLYAEFDNFKRRAARDREELQKFAVEGLVCDLLSVADHLEMAIKHSKQGEGDALDSLVKGVELTLKELERVLEKHGVSAITAIGEPFDPEVHHAMTRMATTAVAENCVAEEFRRGYRLREKVIRPTMVAVAMAPQKEGANQQEPPQGEGA
ncbi:MAG: nucleotide exchange factor GrpE [Nitrospirae bacterium]|nr:nucleotide exchange factor GrpE [Nitrospirota bacterium]